MVSFSWSMIINLLERSSDLNTGCSAGRLPLSVLSDLTDEAGVGCGADTGAVGREDFHAATAAALSVGV